MASTLSYCMMASCMVVLVAGTLLASPGGVKGTQAPAAGPTGYPEPEAPGALLRSVSFFCCGAGGLLLVFGPGCGRSRPAPRSYLNGTHTTSSRDLYYLTVESSEKESYRSGAAVGSGAPQVGLGHTIRHLLNKLPWGFPLV